MDSNLAKKFGRQLKIALKAEKLSQIEVARKLGVSGSAVSQMVNGRMMPSPECFGRLLDLMPLSSDRARLIAAWSKLRTGNFLPEAKAEFSPPLVADGSESLFVVSASRLLEYDGAIPVLAWAAAEKAPLVNCPGAPAEARLIVTLDAAELALPFTGEVELFLGDPETAGCTDLDLINSGKSFMLNPGSPGAMPKKIRRKFPVWELHWHPQAVTK